VPQQQRVAVVTGAGGGIGGAVAAELARRGLAVVVMDPGVGLHGEPLDEPTAAATAQRITEAGGTARASVASVTDRAALRALFREVVAEFGSLDVVVNPAGIVPAEQFPHASQQDWSRVIGIHLGGYLNVLAEALPLMVTAGSGRIVGVTSGAGLARAAAASAAYGCAKRAVAAVTWELGARLPDGVTLNALSPIASTRMSRPSAPVTASTSPPGRRVHQGLDLSALPPPQDMAPVAAYLAGEPACTGQIIFSAGPELSLIGPPRLIEAFSAERSSDLALALDTLGPVVLRPADGQQRTTGGANARVGAVFDQPGRTSATGANGSRPGRCLIVSDHAALAGAVAAAVTRVGLAPLGLGTRPRSGGSGSGGSGSGGPGSYPGGPGSYPGGPGSYSGGPGSYSGGPGSGSGAPDPGHLAGPLPAGFDAAEEALNRAADAAGGVDAIVIALGPFAGTAGPGDPPWPEVLAGHGEVVGQVLAHAGWLSAAARYAAGRSRPVRVVHLADATSPGLRPGAQAVAQLARCANEVQPDLLDVFCVAVETASPADQHPVAELGAWLVRSDQSNALRGAELFARPGWMGLRSHPGPVATLSHGTAALPAWIDDWLRETIPLTGAPGARPRQAEPAG
jgi:NAD(P)-dependent dehydrogenase (short-subunit alcohol dehydrogenase family)